VLLYKFNIYKI